MHSYYSHHILTCLPSPSDSQKFPFHIHDFEDWLSLTRTMCVALSLELSIFACWTHYWIYNWRIWWFIPQNPVIANSSGKYRVLWDPPLTIQTLKGPVQCKKVQEVTTIVRSQLQWLCHILKILSRSLCFLVLT